MITIAALVMAGSAYLTGHFQLSFWLIFAVALNSVVSTLELLRDPSEYLAEAGAAGVRPDWRSTAALQTLAVLVLFGSEIQVAHAAQYF